MIDHVYRFRTIEKLLAAPYEELEKQEIYFARPDELNDPMEGFRDIVWQGDDIVWGNLLKHYLICLNIAWCMLGMVGESKLFRWDDLPLVFRQDPTLIPPQSEIYKEIFDAFFGETVVRSYIDALASRALPIRRNELMAHMGALHPLAIATIFHIYEKRGLVTNPAMNPTVQQNIRSAAAASKTIIDLVKKLESENPQGDVAIDVFFRAQRRLAEQLDFINRYNGALDPTHVNKMFVFADFPEEWVREIERLVYPDWYTACFMTEAHNAAVWATYGDSHKGACLKFRVRARSGRPVLRLRRQVGFGSGGAVHGSVDEPLHAVRYDSRHEPVDFFRNLRAPLPMLKRFWYSDSNGRRSACGESIFNAVDEWRVRYWNTFLHGVTGKLQDWAHEKEYRAVLNPEVLDFTDPNDRKVKYEFADFEGIIFGINTLKKDKLEICKIIEKKCRDMRRTDFKFHQAYYAPESGRIEHAEWGLLKFTMETPSPAAATGAA